MQAQVEMMRFRPGERVSFAHQGARLLGTLAKYNRKTVTVVTDDGQRWNIPPHLLSPVKEVGTTESSPSVTETKRSDRLERGNRPSGYRSEPHCYR